MPKASRTSVTVVEVNKKFCELKSEVYRDAIKSKETRQG